MMPALLTNISTVPSCWTVSSTRRAQTAASPTSPTRAMDLTPRANNFCCVAVGGALEPCTATLAPASPKATAMAAPNPRDEPVTRADFPLRLNRSRNVSCEVRGLSPFRLVPRRKSCCLYYVRAERGESAKGSALQSDPISKAHHQIGRRKADLM